LYRINPGAMRQAGIGIPMEVSFQGPGWGAWERARVIRLLRRSGSECVDQDRSRDLDPGRKDFPYALRLLKTEDQEVRWTVVDSSGAAVRSGRVSDAGGGPWRSSAAVVSSILEELYAVH